MNKYVIKANKKAFPDINQLAFYECILGLDANLQIQSYVATNSALKFNSPKDAVNYFKQNDIKNRDLGTDGLPWIEGPKKGRYSIFTGKLYK